MKLIKNAILLAGGQGTRLKPLTNIYSKSLIPINGKPIIDYTLNTLSSMGVENLTITLGSSHSGQLIDYIKDGSSFQINRVNYVYQNEASGIAQAINLCQRYVYDQEQFAVILGDNIFNKPILFKDTNKVQIILHSDAKNTDEIKRFGVASILDNRIEKIIEKPMKLNNIYDNYPITGLYLFNHKYFEYYKNIKPSWRNEMEICDIINQYHANDELEHSLYEGLWMDAGTFKAINKLNKLL